MKVIWATLCLLLSIAPVVVSGGSSDDEKTTEYYSYEHACIKKHSIKLDGGQCNYEAIAEQVQEAIDAEDGCKPGTDVADELRALFMDDGLSDDELAEKVNLACEDAFYKLMYADGPSYIDILHDSQQQVKEYFDGRGWVNTDHEYERATGLGEKLLKRLPIQWPGDSCFDFDEQIPKKVHSQFHHGHWAKFHKYSVSKDYYGRKTIKPNGHGRDPPDDYYPVQNFDHCQLNTAMCCWTESTDETLVYGPRGGTNVTDSNTDICYVNFGEAPTSSRVRAGFAIFPGLSEVSSGQGSVRCHGFTWAEDPMDVTNFFKGNALFQASFQKHAERGGYISAISGAPMCGCLEQMPVVTRADCTQIDVADFAVNIEITKACIEITFPDNNRIDFSPCTEIHPPYRRKLEEDLEEPSTTTDATPEATTGAAVVTAAASTDAASSVVASTTGAATTTPDETEPPPKIVLNLREHYEQLVMAGKVADRREEVAERLVGEGGCTEVVANFFNDNGIHE